MFLLVAIGSLFYFLKTRVRDMFIMLALAAVFLNFTFITKSTIINHQREEFAKVDARNYYQTISTIIKNTGSNYKVSTNFNAICSEKIRRNIEFSLIENDRLLNYLEDSNEVESKIIFIKLKELDNQKIERIRNLISSKKLQILYDDIDYILISS